MENFKTGRPIAYVVWPLILLQVLIGAVIYGLLRFAPTLGEYHTLVAVLCLLLFSIFIFYGFLLATHPPYFIKVEKSGLMALKLSRTRLDWSDIVRIQRTSDFKQEAGVDFYLLSETGEVTRSFFSLDGYEASPEEIWDGLLRGYKNFKKT